MPKWRITIEHVQNIIFEIEDDAEDVACDKAIKLAEGLVLDGKSPPPPEFDQVEDDEYAISDVEELEDEDAE